MFRFLNVSISNQPCYPRILSFLKEPQSRRTFLDLGCCFAQDVRKLAHDGVPSENLYGCDLERCFLDISYDLYRDKDTIKAHLFTADVLAEQSALDTLEGNIDVIYLGSFLHVFGWDDQLKICKRVIRTLRPRKGSTVFGRQAACVRAKEVVMGGMAVDDKTGSRWWWHDVESFTKLWDLAGEQTATKWVTWAGLDTDEGMGTNSWNDEGMRQLKFEVQRVE